MIYADIIVEFGPAKKIICLETLQTQATLFIPYIYVQLEDHDLYEHDVDKPQFKRKICTKNTHRKSKEKYLFLLPIFFWIELI